MKNANIINSGRLNSGSFLAYHRDALESAQKITLDSFKTEIEDYNKLVDSYGEFTSNTDEAAAQKAASEALEKRNKVFSKFRVHVRSLRDVPNASMQELGIAIWNQLKGTYNVTFTDKDGYTKMVDSTLMNVSALVASEPYATTFKGSAAESYFNELKAAEDAFIAANLKRYEERRKRSSSSARVLREKCMKQFYLIKNHANYVAETEGNEACANFVREVELMANTRRSLYNMRKKMSEKEAEEKKASEQAATQESAKQTAA